MRMFGRAPECRVIQAGQSVCLDSGVAVGVLYGAYRVMLTARCFPGCTSTKAECEPATAAAVGPGTPAGGAFLRFSWCKVCGALIEARTGDGRAAGDPALHAHWHEATGDLPV